MSWMKKMERKFGKYAIPGLMRYVIVLYIIGVIIDLAAPQLYTQYLALDIGAVLHGQIWRLVTFIIASPGTSIWMALIVLYMYYMIGDNLERRWGTFAFNLYFLMGILFNILAAVITYIVFGDSFEPGTYFLNMSLFFAFVTEFADAQFLLFFIIPIKGKWLGYLNAAYFIVTIVGGLLYYINPEISLWLIFRLGIPALPQYALAALFSMLNYVVFYWLYRKSFRPTAAQKKMQRQFKAQVMEAKKVERARAGQPRHRCAVCGRTELDDPSLEFRFCSKCEGNYEYCQDHLFTHEHVK